VSQRSLATLPLSLQRSCVNISMLSQGRSQGFTRFLAGPQATS
jgi:hypothetical protein